MGTLGIEVEPADAGFGPERLARVDRHFARYVDEGKLAGWQLLVTRDGRIAHSSTCGVRDREAGLPVEPDTIWRIYSMTKPITSVAAMMLCEEGLLQLRDPISVYLPEFAAPRVYTRGPATAPATEPAGAIQVRHLLTHTSGLTYGFLRSSPVDEMYRAAGYEFFPADGTDLAVACERWARLPLLFQPGTEWNYGISTDVLGRLVEVVSGMPLDRFFAERIFGPLGMVDTAFTVPHDRRDRLAALYLKSAGGPVRGDAFPPDPAAQAFFSGGGGLFSTTADYHRFSSMLLRRGELDGTRLLGSRTVDAMTRNHLPGGRTLAGLGRPFDAVTVFDGLGFGLGFSVLVDPIANGTLASPGEFGWGGMASTVFWVDPVERITVIFMTQLVPSSSYPLRPQLRYLVNSALVD